MARILLIAALAVALACSGPGPGAEEGAGGAPVAAAAEHTVTFDSGVYTIDRLYSSMEGPGAAQPVPLGGDGKPELLWLTAIRNEAVSGDGQQVLSPEFLCHSNLFFARSEELQRTTPLFAATANLDERIFTMIQGKAAIELPAGFAYPVLSSEPLQFFSMVINKNVAEVPFDVKVRTTLTYLRDADLAEPPQPLFRRRIFTFVEVEGAGGGHMHHPHHGSALEGEAPAAAEMASAVVGHDAAGREYTFHWMVEPGRHEYRSRVSGQLRLPFDTTLHYATAHLHPYGESVEIRDLTTGESLLRLGAEQYSDRVGIARMGEYSDAAGIPFPADHDYELVTVYDNPTPRPIDAMAIVYLFFLDHGFHRTPAAAAG
jgi:hypothetical protein